jgi:predicted Zn-dependent peptidase
VNKKKSLVWLVLAFVLLSNTFLIEAASKPKENFTKVTLKNGLTLMYKTMKDQPMVSMYGVFPIGMSQEKEKGIAHLLEHLVFRGGSGYTFGDITGVTNKAGGQYNGFTSFFATSYNFVVPKEKFATAFKIFNGCIWKPQLLDTEIALEKKIVVHELDMDYSDRYQYYPVFHYFFPEFRYTQETVAAISTQDIKEFHQNYYQPGNVTYIMAGDFDPKLVMAELENITNGYAAQTVPPTTVQPFGLPRQDVVESRNLYPYHYQMMMAYEFSDLTPSERMILKLLSYIYGYDSKIDYLKNDYKIYNMITRSVGNKDYFGNYYLERNHPYSDQAFNEEKANLQKYFRQAKKIDFKKELHNLIEQVKMEVIQSQESAENAVSYEVQRLTNPDNLTIDSLPVLEKLTEKDLDRVIDKYFTKTPTTWILVKTTKTEGN